MKRKIAPVVFLLYFIVQFILLLRVGFTWDEPSILFIGKRNLDFWVSGQWSKGPDYSIAVKPSDGLLRLVWGAKYYPPFLPTIAVALHEIFSTTLHLIPSIPGYHLAGFIIGFLGVVVLYLLLKELHFKESTSLGISLLYGLYPSIVGQMRNDMKDVPLAAAVIVLVYLFIKLLKSYPSNRSYLWTLLLGLAFGFSVLIKPTAAIMAGMFGVYGGVSLLFAKGRKGLAPFPVLLTQGIIVGVIMIVIVIGLWPWTWTDPLHLLTEALAFFRITGYKVPVLYFGATVVTGESVPWHYPFGVLLVQTPLPIIFLFVIGVIAALFKVKKEKDPLPLLFVLWVFLALFRFSLPMFLIYAKVRHLMDALPGMFILAAYGVEFLSKLFNSYVTLPKFSWRSVILGFAILHEIVIVFTFAPFEPSYFNIVAGGTKNVAEKQLFDVEYWGSGVKDAMDYLGRTVTKPVTVYTCTMAHIAKYYNTVNVKTVSSPVRADYFIIPNSRSYFELIFNKLDGNAQIVYTLKRAGAELLYVYKNTGNPFPQCGVESED